MLKVASESGRFKKLIYAGWVDRAPDCPPFIILVTF